MIICDRMASTVGWRIAQHKDCAVSVSVLLLQKLQELLSSKAR